MDKKGKLTVGAVGVVEESKAAGMSIVQFVRQKLNFSASAESSRGAFSSKSYFLRNQNQPNDSTVSFKYS